MLIGTNLTKKYNGQEVLRGADIRISPGEITALIGPSGSGKSTLIRALSLLDPPDSGEVCLDDDHYIFPQCGKTFRSAWPKISVVFQQLFLWPHLTLRQNILLPIKSARVEENIGELIEIFGMGDFIDRYPNQTSLGQRQRAALARAIALRPRYLLLDEITSALDIKQVSAVQKYLDILKNRGTGILIATHLLEFAGQSADRILILDEGKIFDIFKKDIPGEEKYCAIHDFIETVKKRR